MTGHASTRTIFGAAAIAPLFSEEEAEKLLELLFRYGVNHIDTAPVYSGGNSEAVVGRWMEKHRNRFFLATKTLERGKQSAWQSIRASLKKLRTDYVDMIQLHNLTDQAEWETAMGPGGALEACREARDGEAVRFIGVTGHGRMAPWMLLQSLERFHFDAVLLPWNYWLSRDAGYREEFVKLLGRCMEDGVAVQTIKSLSRRPWSGRTPTANTWYEPLADEADIDRAVRWCLSHEGIFLNTVGDAPILPLVLESASRSGTRPTDEEMEAMTVERGMESIFSGGEMLP